MSTEEAANKKEEEKQTHDVDYTDPEEAEKQKVSGLKDV